MPTGGAGDAARPGGRRGRRRRPLLSALTVVLVLLGAVVAQSTSTGSAGAAFTSAATRPADSFATDVLDPVGALSASRSCTTATAPTFRSVSTMAVQGDAKIPRPSGVVAGDAMLAFVMHHDAAAPPTLPIGWTQLRRGATSAGSTLLAARLATASEPVDYTFGGLNSSQATAAAIVAYSGVDQSTPWEAHAALTTATSTVTAPSVAATTGSTTWVIGYLVDAYSGGATPPSPTAQRTATTASGTPSVYLTVGDRPVSATGATGTQVASLSATANATGFSVLLRSATTPKVTLTWAATPDMYASGYAVSRTGTTTETSVTPRTTTSVVDTSLPTSSAATYSVRSAAGTWRSSALSVAVAAC